MNLKHYTKEHYGMLCVCIFGRKICRFSLVALDEEQLVKVLCVERRPPGFHRSPRRGE